MKIEKSKQAIATILYVCIYTPHKDKKISWASTSAFLTTK